MRVSVCITYTGSRTKSICIVLFNEECGGGVVRVRFSVYPVHLYSINLALTCVKCKNASCTSENAEMILGYPMSQMTDPKYTGIVCKQH